MCAHAGLRLNGQSRDFFGARSFELVCRSHGAIYDALSGVCTFGPCKGYSLIELAVSEKGGWIHYEEKSYKLQSESISVGS